MGLKAPSKLGAYIEVYIVPFVKTNMTLFLVWGNISWFSCPISTPFPETKPKTNKTWFSCLHGWWIQNNGIVLLPLGMLFILVFHIFMFFLKSFIHVWKVSNCLLFFSCAASQDLCSSPTTIESTSCWIFGTGGPPCCHHCASLLQRCHEQHGYPWEPEHRWYCRLWSGQLYKKKRFFLLTRDVYYIHLSKMKLIGVVN